VAVIGLSNKKWGEIACAIVVADQSEQQIVEFCGTRLVHYEPPKKPILVRAIPRNPAGKLLKRALCERYR
jgi:acyl-CoA synthetase (AMP-forming)/AMP-acid ligase II